MHLCSTYLAVVTLELIMFMIVESVIAPQPDRDDQELDPNIGKTNLDSDPDMLNRRLNEMVGSHQFETLRNAASNRNRRGVSAEEAAAHAIDAFNRARSHSTNQSISDLSAPGELAHVYNTHFKNLCEQLLSEFDEYQQQLESIEPSSMQKLSQIEELCRQLILHEVEVRVMSILDQHLHPRTHSSTTGGEASSDPAQALPTQGHLTIEDEVRREISSLVNRIRESPEFRSIRAVVDQMGRGESSIERAAQSALEGLNLINQPLELDRIYGEVFFNQCDDILSVFNRHARQLNSIIAWREISMYHGARLLRDYAEACRELLKEETLKDLRLHYMGRNQIFNFFQTRYQAPNRGQDLD